MKCNTDSRKIITFQPLVVKEDNRKKFSPKVFGEIASVLRLPCPLSGKTNLIISKFTYY